MVAQNSVPTRAGQPTPATEGIKLRAARWYISRKLSRRTRADFAGFVVKVLAVRVYSAAACLVSMLLAAWVGAFVRAVSAQNWHVFRTLDGTTLQAASAQAARYQGYLLPVFLCWAVLLLLTPAGYALAFRAVVVAAGILGYLRLAPRSFLVTARVTAISHWLAESGSWDAIPYLILGMALAYVLLSSAVGTFGRLDYLYRNARHLTYYGSPSVGFVRRLCAIPLILLVLLAAVWAATVVRLAASGADRPGAGISYGFQGGLYQSKYLLVAVAVAVAVSLAADSRKWLIIAVIFTGWYGLAPGAVSFTSILEISVGRGQLTHMGTAWGGDSLWAALFVFAPAVVLGIYLVGRLLGPP